MSGHYLHNLDDEDVAQKIRENLESVYGVALKKRDGSLDYDILSVNSSGDRYSSYITEFPGNCSTVIMFSIQFLPKNQLDKHLKFVIDLCSSYHYARLVVSSSLAVLASCLKDEYGFKEMLPPFVNHHSENTNFFLYLEIEPTSPNTDEDKENDEEAG